MSTPLVQKASTGTFHLAVKEAISRYEFAIRIAELARFEPERVDKITSHEMNFYAKRPQNTSIKIDKISPIYKASRLTNCLSRLISSKRGFPPDMLNNT